MTLRLVPPRQAIVHCPNCAKPVAIVPAEKKHACKWCGNIWSNETLPKVLRTA